MIARTVSLACWAILSRPLRSLMMMTTLSAGVTAVVLASAILLGYRAEAERIAFGAYARSLVITENWTSPDRHGPPRLSDLEALLGELGQSVESRSAWRSSRAQVNHGSRHTQLDLHGVSGDYRVEADMVLAAGRAMTDREIDGDARICLLGAGSFARLFPAGFTERQSITVNGMRCRVIGAFQPATSRTADRYADSVIMPFNAAARYFEYPRHLGPDEATQLTLVLRADHPLYEARAAADRVMRSRYGVPLSQPPPFEFADPHASLQAVNAQRRSLARLLLAVAATSLVAGTVGYAAAAMSATDSRRRDFALQMMSGARRIDIVAQIMVEGMLLGAAGAVLAIALAVLGGQALSSLAHIPVAFTLSTIATAAVTGVFAGTTAALVPAWRAASGQLANVARQ